MGGNEVHVDVIEHRVCPGETRFAVRGRFTTRKVLLPTEEPVAFDHPVIQGPCRVRWTPGSYRWEAFLQDGIAVNWSVLERIADIQRSRAS